MGKLIKTMEVLSHDALSEMAESLKRGGTICMATDTVYGLCCVASNEEAVGKLRDLKGAGWRPFLVLIGELGWLPGLAAEIPAFAERLIARHWPGPLTIVFKAGRDVPEWVKDPRGTIAIRYPKCPVCVQLLRAVGRAMVSTSANVQGEEACLTGSEACDAFREKVDFVIDSGRAPMSLPSTIIDVSLPRPTVLRKGVLDIEDEVNEENGTDLAGH